MRLALLLFVSLLFLSGCQGAFNTFLGLEDKLVASFCKNPNQDDVCEESQEVFSVNDADIYASVPYSGLPTDVFAIDWWHLDTNKKIAPTTSRQANDEDVFLKFRLVSNRKRWEPGSYELRVYKNKGLEPVIESRFEIRK